MTIKERIVSLGLAATHRTGLHRLAEPVIGGIGFILTFHRVRPSSEATFQPNARLEVTPTFLGDLIRHLRSREIDIVSLDEVRNRLSVGRGRRFASLTFDDGYRDNLEYGFPILRQEGAPFTIYVSSDFADGEGLLWWIALERAVARRDIITLEVHGVRRVFPCATLLEKQSAFSEAYWMLRRATSNEAIAAAVSTLAATADVDAAGISRRECMNWEELREVAGVELATIGAHTDSHPILSKYDDRQARAAIAAGASRMAEMLGRIPRHFAYPFGDATSAGPREFAFARELGFETAVTTRRGVLSRRHAATLASLPRIPVNGLMPDLRRLDVLTSGLPSALASLAPRTSIVNRRAAR